MEETRCRGEQAGSGFWRGKRYRGEKAYDKPGGGGKELLQQRVMGNSPANDEKVVRIKGKRNSEALH